MLPANYLISLHEEIALLYISTFSQHGFCHGSHTPHAKAAIIAHAKVHFGDSIKLEAPKLEVKDGVFGILENDVKYPPQQVPGPQVAAITVVKPKVESEE